MGCAAAGPQARGGRGGRVGDGGHVSANVRLDEGAGRPEGAVSGASAATVQSDAGPNAATDRGGSGWASAHVALIAAAANAIWSLIWSTCAPEGVPARAGGGSGAAACRRPHTPLRVSAGAGGSPPWAACQRCVGGSLGTSKNEAKDAATQCTLG